MGVDDETAHSDPQCNTVKRFSLWVVVVLLSSGVSSQAISVFSIVYTPGDAERPSSATMFLPRVSNGIGLSSPLTIPPRASISKCALHI